MNLLEMPDARPLNRSTPIARELVHRTALAEVLLTDVRPEPGRAHTFTVAAQWARSHPTFDRAGDGRHNPLMVAETMRQLGICVPLQFYAVPADSHFLIEELHFAVDPAAEPRAQYGGSEITCRVEAEPLEAEHRHDHAGAHGINAEKTDAHGFTPKVQRLRLGLRYFAGGREFGQADGIARFLTPMAYETVRSRRRSAAVSDESGLTTTPRPATDNPSLVGLAQHEDLLIALDPTGRTLLLPADSFHPFFYDHFSDHVPGMVLIEAVRQAAVRQAAEPDWRMTACALRALCFTEPAPPAEIVCEIDDRVAAFEVRQFGNPTATGTLTFEER